MDNINRFEVILSDNAAEMLVTHTRFMLEVNHQAADHLRKTIIEAAKSLRIFQKEIHTFQIHH